MSNDEDIPNYIKDLIIKMDFIGHVPPGRKICIRGKYYQDPESWLTKPTRIIYGEDADTTCDYIDRLVRNLTSIICSKNNIGQRVRIVLKEKALIFRQGLINLSETYNENPNASSKIRTIISVLDHHIPENTMSEIVVGISPIISE